MRVTLGKKGTIAGVALLNTVKTSSKSTKCYRFSRIPYAMPPTGENRWKLPRRLPESFSYSTSTEKCSKPSAVCPQPRNFGPQSTIHSEDCLHCNIWVPVGIPPKGGWPVVFYIHGGFLQFGFNNSDDPSSLLSETDVKCIIVSPGYRLGIFGFLASTELCGPVSPAANFGFWDQRLALEWTYENVRYFGGDNNNITLAGLSAGSYSVFHQLAHDITNEKRQLVRRVCMWSNGCGVEPKRIPEVQHQFDDLLDVLGIPPTLSSAEKVAALRGKTSDELVDAVLKMKQQFFRPILDGNFISKDLFTHIYSGELGDRMKRRGIEMIVGDLTKEFYLYKAIANPSSCQDVIDRLAWDYPRDVAEAICAPYKNEEDMDWKDLFGNVYADMQIHSTMRGLLKCLSQTLPLENIHRYRIDWRTKSVDKRLPKEVGATHGTDMSIWFFGNGEPLEEEEKTLVREWLKPVSAFIKGERLDWGTKSLDEVRYLTGEKEIKVRNDEWWKEKLPLWEVTRKVTESRSGTVNAKL